MSDQLDATREPLPTTSDVVPTPRRQQQHQEQQHQCNSMTNKEILEISRQIMGSEHLALRIHLDLTEAQAFALNEAFPNSQERIYAMLKAWHDVVVKSGENARQLLAAAFVNATSNNLMARKVVGEGVVDAKACPKEATVVRIQKIIFRKEGYDCGDIDLSYDINTKAHVAGHGGINVYGGTLNIEGHLSIAETSRSCNTVSNSLAHDGSQASLHSLNVHGGTVRVAPGGSIAIGPQSAPSYSNSFVRGETQNTMVDGPMLPESSNNSAISGQPFRKDFDNTLSEAMMEILTEQMKSVGVLMSGDDMVGTVFRIGETCIMTALHVVKYILDPGNTGSFDANRLEDQKTYVHFHKSSMIGNVKPPVEIFYLWKIFIWNEELDIAILDIKNPKKLPRKLRLSRSEVDLSDVSLIGYGNPNNAHKKVLDPRCKIENYQTDRMQRVFSWLEQKKSVLRTQLQNPELIDVGYQGYDHPSVMLFDCFVNHGASGAPILSNNNENSVTVVGVLTRGLPEFYFKLPDHAQKDVPDYCKLEMGAKMKFIYDWINKSHPEYVQKFFS